MPLESQKYTGSDVISLTSEYVRIMYIVKWDSNNQKAIVIKNKIVVLLWGLYQDILNGFWLEI